MAWLASNANHLGAPNYDINQQFSEVGGYTLANGDTNKHRYTAFPDIRHHDSVHAGGATLGVGPASSAVQNALDDSSHTILVYGRSTYQHATFPPLTYGVQTSAPHGSFLSLQSNRLVRVAQISGTFYQWTKAFSFTAGVNYLASFNCSVVGGTTTVEFFVDGVSQGTVAATTRSWTGTGAGIIRIAGVNLTRLYGGGIYSGLLPAASHLAWHNYFSILAA